MKNLLKIRVASMLLLLALCAAPFAMAQDDPFEIIGDVDNDGIVGPTDIQHVINGALGLNDQGPEAINRELRPYIVASPRASLAPRPGAGEAEDCGVVGAATNFQRGHGRLLVRAGTGIAFRFDRNVEAVWHENACGQIRTALIVSIRPVEADAEPTGTTDQEGWEMVGLDDAGARRCGPLVATANIAVRHLFSEPGDYLVRCTIRTHVIPGDGIVEGGENVDLCGGVRDVDHVFTRVRVVDRDATEEDVEWQVENDPPTVGRRFGDRLGNGEGEPVELP